MDTAVPPPVKPQAEIAADAAIDKVLRTLREFSEKAPLTTVALCFLAGVGAAALVGTLSRR